MVHSSLRRNKRKRQTTVLAVSLIVFGILVLFWASHSTFFKYNDWWIVGNNIENVRARYGNFDRESSGNNGGTVGYYIGEDNNWLDPTYADLYYWIEYDAEGTVDEVYVRTLPGG